MLGPATFRLLNQERALVFPRAWNEPLPDRHWMLNLHRFHYLHSEPRQPEEELALIQRWIRENPPLAGMGWEPYSTSLRIVNWIRWTLGGPSLLGEVLHSLAVQTRSVRARMESDLLGNHLIANAKALIFAGVFFEGGEAEEWFRHGMSVLRREVREQVLLDGGHFERSPMYHSIVLEDLLDVLNLLRAFRREREFTWRVEVDRMRLFLKALCHPDGDFACFNDAAMDMSVRPAELESYARRLELPAVSVPPRDLLAFRDTGYVRLQCGAVLALLDAAPLGPDYLPGHGHADTFTFELSLGLQRLIVDTGTSTYQECPLRSAQRQTLAHNSLVVDGENSSDVWRSFKVAQRAHVRQLTCWQADGVLVVSAVHNGYRRLRGVGDHRRTWTLSATTLTVDDEMEGRGRHSLAQVFHLHPDVAAVRADAHRFHLRSSGGESLAEITFDPSLEVTSTSSLYHPEFGSSLPNTRLMGRWSGSLPKRLESEIRWRRAQ